MQAERMPENTDPDISVALLVLPVALILLGGLVGYILVT